MTYPTTLLSPGVASPAPASTIPSNDYSEGYHYVIKRKGETVADLVGTMHDDDKSICRLNPTVEEAAKKAKWVAFECLMTEKNRYLVEFHLQRSKSTARKSYEEYNQTNSRNYKLVNIKYKPIYSTSAKEKIPKDETRGAENLIVKLRGDSFVSEIIPLETIEEHAVTLHIWDLFSEIMDQKIQEGIISEADWYLAENDAATAYRNGDERVVYTSPTLLKSLDPSVHYHIHTKRNCIHATRARPLIEKATPDERVMIAIGADHLFGKDGVIELLKQDLGKDYTIERVRGS